MARRRAHTPPPPPFQAALEQIDTMERAVIYRCVSFDFTGQDMLDTLLPADTRRKLRDASPFTGANRPTWDVVLRLGGHEINLKLLCAELDTLTPFDRDEWEGWPEITTKTPLIEAALIEVGQIVQDFNVLRTIVNWLHTEKVTPGCARHYLPGLGSLLPSDHAFHKVDGERFKDNYFSPEIAQAIRRAPEVIAKGLLCDPATHGNKTGKSNVFFQLLAGIRHQMIPLFVV